MQFADKYLQIDQTIKTHKAYAIESTWYNNFQQYIDNLFNCQYDLMESLHNYGICIVSEETNQESLIKSKLQNHFDVAATIQLERQEEQILKKDKLPLVDYVIVNPELWELIITTFSGSPCVPLYSMTRDESKVVRLLRSFKQITFNDQQDIDSNLIIPTENEIVHFVIQTSENQFSSKQLAIPIVFSIKQIIEKILCVDSKFCVFDPEQVKWFNVANSTLLCELKSREFWILYNTMHQKQNHYIQPQISHNFQDDIDEYQIFQDFQQLHQDAKTRSTEPTTESRDVEFLLDASENQQDYIQNLDHFEIMQDDKDFQVKDINDFISDVDLAMKCQKPPLLLQKTNKIIENVNQIIQLIEQELSACLKMEQKEEKTNDEVTEQDI